MTTSDDLLLALLSRCVDLEASDLHLSPDTPPTFRCDGELVTHPEWPALDAAALARVCDELLEHSGRRGLDATGAQDGALSAAGARFRFNVYRRQGGMAVALRRLEDRFRTLEELGLPPALYELCERPEGLVVVAGPTGAGKSTTLAALLDRINRTRRAHVITIEDPVEYLHTPALSLVNQRQVGVDASGFPEALVAALREDPDVIFVGEVREVETIRTAIRAAETGHLVLTTVHASDCVGAVERLVSVFPAEEQAGLRKQLALVLRTLVAQRLLPAEGPAGAAPTGAASAGSPRPRGRVVASEILHGTSAVANLIASGRCAQLYATLEAGGPHGMQSFEQDLARLVQRGRVQLDTALAHAREPESLRQRLAHHRERAR